MIEEIFQNKFVYKTRYPKASDLANLLISKIEDNIELEYNFFSNMKDGGICCVVENNKYPLESQLPKHIPWVDYLNELSNFVEVHALEYVNAYNLSVIPKIEGSWISYYPDHAYFDFHKHIGVAAVAVLYLQKKENAGNMWIKESDEGESVEIVGNEGELIIFPGFLPHKTTPNLSNSKRIVITFDIMYTSV